MFFWVPVLLGASISLMIVYCRGKSITAIQGIVLVAWHTMFSFVYLKYSETNASDANGYYLKGLLGDIDWNVGTKFVYSLCVVLVQTLGMSKLSSFMFFNLVGIIGLIFLMKALTEVWPVRGTYLDKIPVVMLFLPGVSFWTSAIGKDAPAFSGLCMLCYGVLNIAKRKMLITIGLAAMFAVRPHIALILISSLVVSLVVSRRDVSLVSRGVIALAGVAVGVFIAPLALGYVGLATDASIDDVADIVEKRQGYNLGGGASVDIQSMSLPMQMITYMFRPLFIDADGAFGLIVSAENVILIGLFIMFIPSAIKCVIALPSLPGRFCAIYLVVGLAVLASTTSNMGIAIRQKTMLLPALFLLIAISERWRLNRKRNMGGRPQGSGRLANAGRPPTGWYPVYPRSGE